MLNKRKTTPNQRQTRQPAASDRPEVFSYYASRNAADQAPGRWQTGRPQPGRLPSSTQPSKEQRRRWSWRLLPSALALAAIAGCLLYSLTLNTTPRLSYATANSGSLLQADEVYIDALRRELQDSPWNYTKLTINTRQLEDRLLAEHPELAAASITIPLLSRRPILAIKSAEPALVLLSDGRRYLVDAQGKLIIDATRSVQDAVSQSLPVVQDESGLAAETGQTILPASDVKFLTEVAHQLTAAGLAIDSLRLPPVPNEVHAVVTGEPYFVKFNTHGEGRLQVGTYLAVREHLSDSGVRPAEYIDVRVDEKAYYK